MFHVGEHLTVECDGAGGPEGDLTICSTFLDPNGTHFFTALSIIRFPCPCMIWYMKFVSVCIGVGVTIHSTKIF